ncbi:MAG: hypothetical protein GQ527_13235 [Bacteroidales bacterium]|nr:hypothetical protein [Bacteroidales bacterium]
MKKIIITSLSIILFVSFSFSQNFSTSGLTGTQSKGQNDAGKSVDATYFITHSNSQTIDAGVTASCNGGGLHTDNSYLRVFDLVGDFGINEDIDVVSVEFGIETAAGASGDQPVTVNVYTLSGAFVFANLTLIATEAVTVADQTLTIFTVPISAAIPTGSTMVIEIFTPDGQGVGNSFYFGSNSGGQTDDSYIAAAACGINEPTSTGAIGFGHNHYVINVNADPAGGPSAVPIKSWSVIISLLLMATFVVYRIRK